MKYEIQICFVAAVVVERKHLAFTCTRNEEQVKKINPQHSNT